VSQTHDLRRAVLAALVADPQVSTGHIGVSAQASVVTLTGYVANCGQREAACRATRRVGGVSDVVNCVLIAVPSRREVRPALG
jgi:osmotically-inducible protein OsmY